jgi:hypothetical protein
MAKSSSKSNVRKYVPRSEKDVDEHANQSGGNFDSIFKQNVDTWSPKQGENTIRFLEPTWDDHRHYGYEIFIHNRVGADNSSYLCLNKMKKKPCPICEAQLEAKRAGEEDDAKQLSPTKRFICWILDRGDRDPDPQIYSMSWTVDRDIAALCKNKRTGKILFIDHPYEGYDVSFTRKGADIKTKYFGFQIDHESSPLIDDDKKLEDIREFITENPIPDQLKFYSYEHLKQVVTGATEDKDEELDETDETKDADEENTPRKRPARDEDEEEDERPKRSRSRRDEDDEPEEDVEEEDERPAKKKPTTRAKSRVDEDEEEPPFEDDEEEERPSKTKRRR